MSKTDVNDVHRQSVKCTPEHRRRVYRAVAARLQRFADAHPDVRHDLATPEINRSVERIDEALVLFMEGKCGREKVSMAFDDYERSLLETARRLRASASQSGV
ncbi:MAG: hypothetical protein MSG64_20505 [Pyrinomonadaceae bacterium MAG19_C2-C3]|nr:hypothetical protein [Pyrinomonadaceae bacterium MAG19_C2-C3]